MRTIKMKYAFIDYENIHSLDNIKLGEYEKIYLFLGAQQQYISLSEKFNDQLNIHLITIKNVSKNNLDFHLAYFLGKADQEADKQINFDVISKDKGYQGICDYIQNQKYARKCQLISITPINTEQTQSTTAKNEFVLSTQDIEKYTNEYQQFMSKTDVRHLPTTVEKLTNHIYSQTNVKTLPQTTVKTLIPQIIENLSNKQLIVIKDKKINYQITNLSSLYTKYESFLLKREKLKRPQKLSSLKNEIASKLNLRGNTAKINEIVKLLKEKQIIENQQEDSIVYQK